MREDVTGLAAATTTCPGCGLVLPSSGTSPDPRFNASAECQALCGVLADDPALRADPTFPYQTVVDAYAAQHPSAKASPIGLAFALIGLYLKFARGYTGKEVQRAHMRLARRGKDWPRFPPPARRGALTILDVVNEPSGPARLALLDAWARAVWETWALEHDRIAALLSPES